MSWEPVDWRNGRNEVRDFFGVFETYGTSPQPGAIFEVREEAEDWIKLALAGAEQHEDSDMFCICVCREGHDGRLFVWNGSPADAPDGLAVETT